MTASNTIAADVTLTLTEEERTELLNLLEQVLRDKEVEEHRTESFAYRAFVSHQEDILRGLIAKLQP